MAKAISATKFRNAVRRIDPEVTCKVKNIRINGELRGYSGFITKDDRVVYVNHEVDPWSSRDEGYYRVAKNDKDYRGGRNRFAQGDIMAERAVELINHRMYEKDGPIAGEQSLRDLRGW